MSTRYAIHVKPGCEAQAVELLSGTAKRSGLEELFCPMSVLARREHGEIVEERLPLIPGCVFAVAPSKRELRACVRRADGMEALYAGQSSFEALQEGESALIELFTEPGKRVVAMSEGVVDGGRVAVERGQLAGREQMIRKASHRKRRAYLDASVAGSPAVAELGLYVTRRPDAAGEGG